MSDEQKAADALRKAVSDLNSRATDARRLGLNVDLELVDVGDFQEGPGSIVNVEVQKSL